MSKYPQTGFISRIKSRYPNWPSRARQRSNRPEPRFYLHRSRKSFFSEPEFGPRVIRVGSLGWKKYDKQVPKHKRRRRRNESKLGNGGGSVLDGGCDGSGWGISGAPEQMIWGRARTTAAHSGNSKEHLLLQLKPDFLVETVRDGIRPDLWPLETSAVRTPQTGKSLLSGAAATLFFSTTTRRLSVEWMRENI